MSRFNLIEEKWIPVRLLDGSRDELGIRETLVRATEISEIEDPSPLVVAALYRFLLAVLYRALEGPTDIEQAKALFKNGLPHDKINAYLEKWKDRFWLFDKRYPFGQNPRVTEKAIGPWTKLTAEYNATSNKVLFDHTDMKRPGSRKPKECARWLLSTMSFSIAGGRGYYPSPSPNAMMCIPIGRNLHQTLCYCLVPYPNKEAMKGDSALWEHAPRSLPLGNPKRSAGGYADIYTWQARMIHLEESTSGDVQFMRFVSGLGFDNPSGNPDPMQPYRMSDTLGKLPVQFREDRGTWRDFDSLLPDQSDLAPLTLQHALRLAKHEVNDLPSSVLVLGLRYEPPNANVDFWRMERFVFPPALASDREIRSEIARLLKDATEAQTSLWDACSSFARDTLSRGTRKPDKADVRAFVRQMPVSGSYWSILESHFHEALHSYTLESDSEDIRCTWLKSIRSALLDSWGAYRTSVSMGDAWAIRAIVKAEVFVNRKLKELAEEIVKIEPRKEVA